MSTKHAAEVKLLMDVFAAYNGTVSKGELLMELKAPKMRQVYDYLYWADREQGIVIKAVRTGREVTAYQHVSGTAQPVPTVSAPVKVVKSVKTKIKATTSVVSDSEAVVKVAKAAAKKVTTKTVKKAKVVKKTETKPDVEKVRKGEVASYSVDPDFDANDPLAIPDFLKR
jgi:hypothetical protein